MSRHSGVPIGASLKVPLIPTSKGGHGLHDAATDLDVIRAWRTRTPNANIGLRIGLVFDVIDLDGEAAVDALEEARAGGTLRGPVVQTGHGFHWYTRPT